MKKQKRQMLRALPKNFGSACEKVFWDSSGAPIKTEDKNKTVHQTNYAKNTIY